ncbi:MAG: MBL fold metallo-hydrolase [Acidobacteria bacterium]|nr:MBL fold metallo-hydrolase [Acidobacteriota bacterium]
MRRLFLILGFAGLAGLALFTARIEALPETIQQIAPGVWFREGDLKQYGHCNNIIIEMKDYLIVVDANFPSGAKAALADARKVSSKPVKFVFDTHHHGDHAYGNPVWTEMGAITLAHQGVAEEMKRYEPKRWQEAAKQRKDVGDLKLATAEPPKQTFDKSPFVLSDDTRRVEFHFFGWAHTRGDGFVYLPKEQILCTGDAVVNGPYNYTGDANLANWPNVVRKARALKVSKVLLGHGVPGDAQVLAGQEAYMTELYKAVKAEIGKGRKVEEIQASLQLPDRVKHWVGDFQKNQIKDAYEEITQKKPHGEIMGGK